MTAGVVAFISFLIGTVIGGRFARHLDYEVRRWLTAALGTEVVLLTVLAILAGTGVVSDHDNGKLILIGGLAITFGAQNAAARQFGVQELSTTVLTSTIVGIGVDSRLAGGTGDREKLRYTVVLTILRRRRGGGDDVPLHGRTGHRPGRGGGREQPRDLPVRSRSPKTSSGHARVRQTQHERPARLLRL